LFGVKPQATPAPTRKPVPASVNDELAEEAARLKGQDDIPF
jgi:hypothetical protein